MTTDYDKFQPPTDRCFGVLLEYAVPGSVPVYGALLDAEKMRIRRCDENWRPENSAEGQKIVASLVQGWNTGRPVQQWLYVEKGVYVCADDWAPADIRCANPWEAVASSLNPGDWPAPARPAQGDAAGQMRDMTNISGKRDGV